MISKTYLLDLAYFGFIFFSLTGKFFVHAITFNNVFYLIAGG